ncbi:MAG: hypothetical protein U0T74_02185 [Chitinophagales bacterium]
MKLFFSKLVLLGLLLLLLLNFIVAPLLIEVSDRVDFFSWSYIYARVLNAKKKHSFSKIVLGDSVGAQLYQPKKYPYSFCTNGSVLLAGNFVLLQNYLKNNPAPDTLIFVCNPRVFATDFFGKMVFNSFCKPFNTGAHQAYFTPELKELLKTNYKYRLSQYPFYKVLGCIDDPVPPAVSDSTRTFISDINLSYLKKIDTLVRQKHMYCRFVSPSVNAAYAIPQAEMEHMKQDIDQAGCAYLFSNYWSSVQYLDAACFGDYLHYTHDYLQQNLKTEQNRLENYY